MPFDQSDLLRQIGLAEGDTLVQYSASAGETAGTSISSSSLVTVAVVLDDQVSYEAINPAGAQLRARLIGTTVDVGSGETVTINLIDTNNSLTLASETISSKQAPDSGWTDVDTSNVISPARVVVEAKTEPGTNPGTLREISLLLGVQL